MLKVVVDTTSIKKQVRWVLYYQNLINKGRERAKLFSWERTAKSTLKAYRTIV
jgi:glycosyltransferase involved in cell wall biosynthesis